MSLVGIPFFVCFFSFLLWHLGVQKILSLSSSDQSYIVSLLSPKGEAFPGLISIYISLIIYTCILSLFSSDQSYSKYHCCHQKVGGRFSRTHIYIYISLITYTCILSLFSSDQSYSIIVVTIKRWKIFRDSYIYIIYISIYRYIHIYIYITYSLYDTSVHLYMHLISHL